MTTHSTRQIFRSMTAVLLAGLLLGAAPAPVRANSPTSLVLATVVSGSGPMPADQIAVTIEVYNGEAEAVTVTFPAYRRDGIALTATPQSLSLDPDATATIQLAGSAATAGRFAVFLRPTVADASGVEQIPTEVSLYLRVANDVAGALVVTLEDFETLFVNEGGEDLPGIGYSYAASSGRPKGTKIRPKQARNPERMPLEDYELPPAPRAASINITVSGQWRFLDSADAVRPGLGWRARLYRKSGSDWVDTGYRAWVDAKANFKLTATVPLNAQLLISMIPSNRYFSLVTNNHLYYFHLPTFTANKTAHNYGPHYADLSPDGVVPGLGDVHGNAYDLWQKLEDADFSPVRPNPINIVFPGTAKCGSCSLDTAVHIAASAGGDFHAIRHELGHELMYEKWGGMPENSGGYHNWTKCSYGGLALSEGFAHFLSDWSRIDRATLKNTSGWGSGWGTTYNLETVPDFICKNIGASEVRVASTFWDLYDDKADGVDTYTRPSKGKIMEMILDGGAIHDYFGSLLFNRLLQTGGNEWYKIEPIAEMDLTDGN